MLRLLMVLLTVQYVRMGFTHTGSGEARPGRRADDDECDSCCCITFYHKLQDFYTYTQIVVK